MNLRAGVSLRPRVSPVGTGSCSIRTVSFPEPHRMREELLLREILYLFLLLDFTLLENEINISVHERMRLKSYILSKWNSFNRENVSLDKI